MRGRLGWLAVAVFLLGFAGVACEQEGPAEKAGKRVDEVYRDSIDKADKASEGLQKQLDAIGKKVERHVEEAERKMTDD